MLVDIRRKAVGAQQQGASGNFDVWNPLGKIRVCRASVLDERNSRQSRLKTLARQSETGRGVRKIFMRSLFWWFSESSSSDVVRMLLPATEHHGHGFLKCRKRDLASISGHYFCFLALMVG